MVDVPEDFSVFQEGVEGQGKAPAEEPIPTPKIEPSESKGTKEDFSVFQEGFSQPEKITQGDFSDFQQQDKSPRLEEAISIAARSATGELLETGPIIGGVLGGGALGAPLGPAGALAGAALGGIAGLITGKPLRKFASEFDIPFFGTIANPPAAQLPEEQRPAAFAGEVIGGGVIPAAVPIAAAARGARLAPSFIGNFINRTIETAGRAPKAFVSAEAAGLAGAAVGAGAAERLAPGETGIRVGSEIVGGLFNPTRLIVSNAKNATSVLKRAVEVISPSGRESASAKKLTAIIEEAGDDPEIIAEMLLKPGVVPGLTAAQKTGNKALAELEASIAKSSAKFGADAAKSAGEGLKSVGNMIIALRGTGDPAALTAAAEIRQKHFRTLISSRVKIAEEQASEAAAKITKDTPETRAELSRTASNAVGSALKETRKVENSLWSSVPRDLPIRTDNIIEKFAEIKSQMLPEEKLSGVVEAVIKRLEKEGGETTSGELILLRSRSLVLAREADEKGDFNDARVFGQIAESALDDLDALFSGPSAGVLRATGVDTEAYNQARAFTRELHDTFTRTLAGTSLETGPRGKDRIPPEVLLKRAMSGGGEVSALKLRELEEATRFLPTRNLGGPEAIENHNVMVDSQERLLRLAGASSADPVTGAVSPKKLQKFINENGELMSRFPEAADDLKKAVGSQLALKDIENVAKGSTRIIENKAVFSKVANTGNPAISINRIVNSGKAVEGMNQLAKLAKSSGKEATDGLKASIWDHAIDKATNATGDVSMARFRSSLFDPIQSGKPSLIELMKKQGIISESEIKQTEELFSVINNIGVAIRGRGGIDSLEGSPDALVDLFLSIGGSKLSTNAARFLPGDGSAGTSLIAAGRGASRARNMFQKVPGKKKFMVLQEAARSPEFMAMLLKKTASQEEALKLNQQIHSYLWQAGLISEDEAE